MYNFFIIYIVISDNIDTKGALNALRDLVTSSNIYLKEKKSPNTLLLNEIAVYATKILKVFGAIPDNTKFGFPTSNQTSNNVRKVFYMLFNMLL